MDVLTDRLGKKEQFETFLKCLFRSGDRIEFRLIGPADSRRQKFIVWKPETDSTAMFDWLTKLNKSGSNVYVGVHPRTRNKGDESSVESCRVLCTDWDGVPWQAAIEAVSDEGIPYPTMVIESGHGTHAYWVLGETVTPQAWSKIQRAMNDRLGGDPKICDSPRVMRVPGFDNVKGDPVPCELVTAGGDPHDPVEFPTRIEERLVVSDDGRRVTKLNSATDLFLKYGAPEGSRNHRAFAASCDMLASGMGIEEVRRRVTEAGGRCGLDAAECESVVHSASTKHREKMEDPYDLGPEIEQWLESLIRVDESRPKAVSKEVQEIRGTVVRPAVTNMLTDRGVDSSGEVQTIVRPLSMDDCAKPVIEGDLLRSVGGLLFTEIDGEIRTFDSVEETFGHLHQRSDLSWISGGLAQNPRKDGKRQSFISKGEFHAALPSMVVRHESIEMVPHIPPVDRCYYTKKASIRPGDQSSLVSFLDMLTPATHIDRQAILAMLLSGLWGGPCGARPLFIIGSADGRGAGKTTLAECAAAIFGGAIRISESDAAKDITQRMVSDGAMTHRVVIFDNQKRPLGGQFIEASITAPKIEGHRLYFGRVERANRFLWIATSNAFSLTHDLAQRAVPIHLVKPDYTAGDPLAFVNAHRDEILSGLASMFSIPPASAPHGYRWPLWAKEVLGRTIDPNTAIASFEARRAESDDDADLAFQLAEAIDDKIQGTSALPVKTGCFILSLKYVRDAMVEAELVKPGDTVQVAMRKLNEIADLEPLRTRLSRVGGRGKGRRVKWRGVNCEDDSSPIEVYG